MCERRYSAGAVAELQQIAAEYPYGPPPAWWGRGREAAGQAARDAIALSVRVGARLRELAGVGGDTLALRTSVPKLFQDEAEQVEAYRLLDLAARIRRRIVEKTSENYLDGHLEPETRNDGAGESSASES